MVTLINQTTDIGGVLNGEYKPLNEIHPSIQKIINEFEGLVLIREKLLKSRTTGTLWYKGKVLCFTVEDLVRKKKTDDITAIPDVIKDVTNIETLDPKPYYLTLDTTGNKNLVKNYVKFPNDKRTIFRSPGVFARVGTDITAVNLNFDGLSFGGIRIHAGSSENSSSGCIIISRTRKADGTVLSDLEASHNVTKWIYNNLEIGKYDGKPSGNNFSRMIVINEFEFPPPPPITETSATVVNEETNQPINGVTIEPLSNVPLLSPTLLPSNINPSESMFLNNN
jgi:hypothetical protein